MTIELRPEDEKLIRKRLRSGAFETAEEVVHDALASQSAEAEWLDENREAIQEKIARGLAELDRGEGIPGEVARARLQESKMEWLRSRGK